MAVDSHGGGGISLWRWCENKRIEEEMGFIRKKGHNNTYIESFNVDHWFNPKAINYSYHSFSFKFNLVIAFDQVKIRGGLSVAKRGEVRGLESDFLIGGQNCYHDKYRGSKMHLSLFLLIFIILCRGSCFLW